MVSRREFLRTATTAAAAPATGVLRLPDNTITYIKPQYLVAADDTAAIQAAIDEAATRGAKVFLPAGQYNISDTLVIPAGVMLIGEGVGASPTQITQARGTLIHYDAAATGWAMRFEGHTCGMRDVLVMTKLVNSAEGGILVETTGSSHVESATFSNVLIYGFTNGTGLKLFAHNGGGMAYCSFYDVRVRHGKIGIHIQQIRNNDSSFVNSNSFYRGAVSGGGFDYGLLIDGGNNNVFHGMVIEPSSSTYGHIVVNEGQIEGRGIRLEASAQPASVPIVEFKHGTYDSILEGFVAHGIVLDRGHNQVLVASDKTIGPQRSGRNLFENAAFNLVSGNNIPFWTVTNGTVSVAVSSAEILANHNVLTLTVPAGVTAQLKPNGLPARARDALVRFGAYIKTNTADVVFTTINGTLGLSSSDPHPGDDEWHFIGMAGVLPDGQEPTPQIWLNNSGGSGDLTVLISVPTFSYGGINPQLDAATVSSAGGTITGTLSLGMNSAETPSDPPYELILPHQGNLFEITSSSGTIARLNTSRDRFPKGTTIILSFPNAGVNVQHGAFINLLGGANFVSTTNSSLTLAALDVGVWREIGRNV